ncbi:MAG: leucyl/phenylalanyl-tRNA--protein transferase, partial [Abditibacteriales bacterium]|nr:leucyl/phenylalanyl-tRNA--protein transferase [Abditibacteriales bacterium]MDW8366240.1 leucyl/phenylalanyl-tRNA--protein transferase [Abditibacteriales bacterium]
TGRFQTAMIIPPHTLITAYCQGVFPMADPETGEVSWFTADPRGVLDLEEFHVPQRLQRLIKKRVFSITVDTAFEQVIRGCAQRADSWISEGLVRSYLQLHALGYAHSVEAWKDGTLAGGLYGVSIGGAFFGESMFHRVSNASKVALVFLVERLKERGYVLLDTQMVTRHMAQFGAKYISQAEYLRRLARALRKDCRFA